MTDRPVEMAHQCDDEADTSLRPQKHLKLIRLGLKELSG